MKLSGTLAGILFAQPMGTAGDGASTDTLKKSYVNGYARIVDESALPFQRLFNIVGRAKTVRPAI